MGPDPGRAPFVSRGASALVSQHAQRGCGAGLVPDADRSRRAERQRQRRGQRPAHSLRAVGRPEPIPDGKNRGDPLAGSALSDSRRLLPVPPPRAERRNRSARAEQTKRSWLRDWDPSRVGRVGDQKQLGHDGRRDQKPCPVHLVLLFLCPAPCSRDNLHSARRCRNRPTRPRRCATAAPGIRRQDYQVVGGDALRRRPRL